MLDPPRPIFHYVPIKVLACPTRQSIRPHPSRPWSPNGPVKGGGPPFSLLSARLSLGRGGCRERNSNKVLPPAPQQIQEASLPPFHPLIPPLYSFSPTPQEYGYEVGVEPWPVILRIKPHYSSLRPTRERDGRLLFSPSPALFPPVRG
jgi:hypothetical protein